MTANLELVVDELAISDLICDRSTSRQMSVRTQLHDVVVRQYVLAMQEKPPRQRTLSSSLGRKCYLCVMPTPIT